MDRQLLDAFKTRLMTTALQTESVSYQYPHQGHGLAPITLEVNAGEMVLLTGPSGSGKSTLARCLAGLIPHLYHGEFSGTVTVNGFRTDNSPRWRIAESVGFVFQNVSAQMLASSVKNEIIFGLENLGLERSDIDSRINNVIQQFDLQRCQNRNPLTLSGGEQQKVALAAILSRAPSVLVLDEPLSMLDSGSSIDLINHLVQLTEQGTAIIICEHKHEYLHHLPLCRSIEINGSPHAIPCELYDTVQRLSLSPTPPFDLQVVDLNVSINHRRILKDINFTVPGGQVIAIVGKNGSGKTTLLRAISGLQKYDGRITAGHSPVDISMVFQNPDLQLFNSTVQDEILYKIHTPDMVLYTQLIHILGLQSYIHAQPLLLSEGEKKRVSLATALMQTPQHGIILDEPSLGQDSAHKSLLLKLNRAVAATGRIVILTTHDLAMASHADYLLVLNDGRIIEQGIPAKLFSDSTLWADIGMPVPDWVLEQIA
jgi:energy-coupling factor transporter ATP-binding protein EcfA2